MKVIKTDQRISNTVLLKRGEDYTENDLTQSPLAKAGTKKLRPQKAMAIALTKGYDGSLRSGEEKNKEVEAVFYRTVLQKVATNGDVIRAMSDADLEAFLMGVGLTDDQLQRLCGPQNPQKEETGAGWTAETLSQWIRQEAKNCERV